MMKTFKPPSPQSGGIFLSYTCNASCKHCMYACSPGWQKNWMSSEHMKAILTNLTPRIQASPYGSQTISLNHGLHFTGGEPFLNFDLLLESITVAKELGIPSLFAETNAFWCRSNEDTLHKMRRLKEAGLSGLLVSVNPFILESVPFDRAIRATTIGFEIFGHNLIVYQTDYFRQFRTLKIVSRMPLQTYIEKVGQHEATSRIELLPIGRTAYTLGDWFEHAPAHSFFGSDCSFELQRDYHNHWDNYGNVLPGFCAGITLGNILEQPALYEEGLDVEQDYPLLGMLLNNGVEGLYQYAHKHFQYQENPDGYISKCHLCLDIRTQIVRQTQEFQELRPLEFYTHI